jgi:hypothetical protein
MRFKDLEVHYVNNFDDGFFSNILYFIVNTKSGEAFWVDDTTQELVEARIIRRHPRYENKDEMNRYFDNHGFRIAGRLPQGDDLFRSTRLD